MARALDILGERWTLLVVRELLLGPKRFKDLLAILPAMGTNRLSERLTMLAECGVVHLAAPPTHAYALTELGERLRAPVIALGLWGLSLPLDERINTASARAELIALCLTGAGGAAAGEGARAIYQFHVGAETFHVVVEQGVPLARSGPSAHSPDVALRCDIDTFLALALRRITPERAFRERRAVLLRGTRQAFIQIFNVLEYRP